MRGELWRDPFPTIFATYTLSLFELTEVHVYATQHSCRLAIGGAGVHMLFEHVHSGLPATCPEQLFCLLKNRGIHDQTSLGHLA